MKFIQCIVVAVAVTVGLAACATVPPPTVERSGAIAPVEAAGTQEAPTGGSTAPGDAAGTEPRLHYGTGEVINQEAASAPVPRKDDAAKGARFSFEGESVHAVVKAILGDLLGQNYVIAPGVQGTVTLATPNAVSPAEAFGLLEQVLSWNGARIVYSDGRYNIVPADGALAGTLAPKAGVSGLPRGFEARVVPLQYVGVEEMKKILAPYARPNAIVATDANRNVITLAGTRAELDNYLRTIRIFDVDWLAGMSVGVFPLQSGRASGIVNDLERVFGPSSDSPVAGMFRFLPLDGANALVVITPQASYLDQVRQWIGRIDGAGEGERLYSHELKYVSAGELAERLAEVFGGRRANDTSMPAGGGSLMPALQPTTIDEGGTASIGGAGGMGGGAALPERDAGGGAVTLEVQGSEVGVSAVEETNTLLVRASPAAWNSILEVIERLDVMPLQVQIEAQVVEVTLTGDLKYGVNWFFENAIEPGSLREVAETRDIYGDIAGSIGGISVGPDGSIGGGLSWSFLGRNALAVVNALDQVTDVRLLQTPSVVVRNNAEASFNVGSRIPIASVTFNPNSGSNGNTFSQVQYLETGVILKVRPRVTRDGMVFLDVVQEISSPGSEADVNGNVRINTRKLKTEAAIHSGETVMLAGLISDTVGTGSSGVPGLSRIPVIGALFGSRSQRSDRSEVIVLLTPRVLRNPQEARELTDEYSRRFRALEPLCKAGGCS